MRKIVIISITLFCISADWVRMPVLQDPNAANTKIKATFIYNFTKYIDWPEKYKEGNFIIGVLGTTTFYNDLTNLLSKKSVGKQIFEIKSYTNSESIGNGTCHILFITAENSGQLPDIIKKLKRSEEAHV